MDVPISDSRGPSARPAKPIPSALHAGCAPCFGMLGRGVRGAGEQTLVRDERLGGARARCVSGSCRGVSSLRDLIGVVSEVLEMGCVRQERGASEARARRVWEMDVASDASARDGRRAQAGRRGLRRGEGDVREAQHVADARAQAKEEREGFVKSLGCCCVRVRATC